MAVFQTVHRLLRRVERLEVPIYAAYAAYFWILAIFPAMLLLITVLQYTPVTAADLRSALEQLVPASLQPLTDYMIGELFAGGSPAALSLSAAAALWMTAKGVLSLQRGLNRIYGTRETRSFLRLRLHCLLFSLAGLLATVLMLSLHLAGQDLIARLLYRSQRLEPLLRLSRLRYVVAVLVLTAYFAVLYTVLPNRTLRLRASLPGAFAAALLWVIFSQLFTLYVEHFTNYSLYYGSLAVIAMALLWLYTCIFLFFCGGILNRSLERRRVPIPAGK